MRTTIHCDEDALFRHIGGTPVTAELEAHIAACPRCSEELSGLRHITTALRVAQVWIEKPPPATDVTNIAEIAALSRRMKREDEEACQVCDEILIGPAAWWETRFRNGGLTPPAPRGRRRLEGKGP